MKLNIILFIIHFLLLFYFPNKVNSNLINEINKNTEFDIIVAILNFLNEHTNIKDYYDLGGDLSRCITSVKSTVRGRPNYFGLIGFSGKGVSDLGLEEECIRNNYIYYLLTYDYINGSYVTFSNQTNTFLFFQQNTFYTGLCLTIECNKFLNFLFNKTLDAKFYDYIKKNLNIQNAKIYDIGRIVNTTRQNAYDTYEDDGTFNYEKTKHEEQKYNGYIIVQGYIYIILAIQFLASLFIHIIYEPYIKTKELKKEISEEESSCAPEEENIENKQIFNIDSETKEKENISCWGKFYEFINTYFNMFKTIKILLKKNNQYYNSSNLEIICYLRIFCMIIITFINNFEVLIKIPSKDFFYDKFYSKFTFSILKYTSFGVDMWICLDGFETMYKLISYYKKYVFVKNKASISFKQILKFYLYSFYKIISFFILFLLANYFNKYYINTRIESTLYEYYSNHIYNDKLEDKDLFSFLIPGYTFYYSYYNNVSIFEDTIISKFSLLLINEFYVFTIFIIIFYISNLLKSNIFDILILIINIILYLLNYWICTFKSDENTYYSYKLVLDNFLTVRYPHIIFNYFFFGAMAGLTCFYYKDSFSNNSLSNDNEKCPFRFCYNMIKFFDYLIQNGRFFWIILILLLQLFICFSFNILLILNNNSFYIPLNAEQKIVLCYETGLFIILFCFIIIMFYFIKNENDNKDKNYSSLIFLIDRTNISFINLINLTLYSYYCIFSFQLKLSYQNLWIITFGLFFLICFENLISILAFVYFFKITNRKIVKYCFSSKKTIEIFNKQEEELLDKSRDSQTIK